MYFFLDKAFAVLPNFFLVYHQPLKYQSKDRYGGRASPSLVQFLVNERFVVESIFNRADKQVDIDWFFQKSISAHSQSFHFILY